MLDFDQRRVRRVRDGSRRVSGDDVRRNWILHRRNDDRSGCRGCWVRQSIIGYLTSNDIHAE